METKKILYIILGIIILYFFLSASTSSSENNKPISDPASTENNSSWQVYKDNTGSFLAARKNKDNKFECMTTDAANCFWRSSYGDALNDVNNPPANLRLLSDNWQIVPA